MHVSLNVVFSGDIVNLRKVGESRVCGRLRFKTINACQNRWQQNKCQQLDTIITISQILYILVVILLLITSYSLH